MDPSKPDWERQALVDLAGAGLKEQRKARRWGIFFKLLGFAYLLLVLVSFVGVQDVQFESINEAHTALVDLNGVIADGQSASADTVVAGLRDAFESEMAVAIILRINSPGGSPVQSAYINNEITRLRTLYPSKPLYAVISDVCASGGYYVAVAADKIYANESSIVGSIGVRMDGFGFVDTIKKLGVERRLLTAGEHKAVLDPFSKESDYEKAHVQNLLNEVHDEFIAAVKKGRADKLVDDPKLFSGLFWTGERALALGLVDELGSAGYVAREVIEVDNIIDYTYKEDFFEKFANNLGSAIVNKLDTSMNGYSLK
jgi:protease-4